MLAVPHRPLGLQQFLGAWVHVESFQLVTVAFRFLDRDLGARNIANVGRAAVGFPEAHKNELV